MNFSIEQCEAAVKQMLIESYFNNFCRKTAPDEFVDSLNRIFKQKKKVIHRLALYIQSEVAKGHDPARTLANLDFFAVVLKEFLGKNNNQPMNK